LATSRVLSYEIRSRANALDVARRCRILRKVLSRGLAWPDDVAPLKVRDIYLIIRDDYVPLPARIEHAVLVKATEAGGPDEAARQRFDDPLLGWGRLVDGRLDAVDCPGGHSSMLQEPAVQTVAAILTKLLCPEPEEAEAAGIRGDATAQEFR
jgi:thioesterase domain-containing protein